DDARSDLVVLGRGEDAGLAELARELGTVVLLVAFDKLMDTAAGEIAEVDFAIGVFAPAHDAIGCAGEFSMLSGDVTSPCRFVRFRRNLSHLLFFKPPNSAGVEVSVNVLALKLLQTLPVIYEAAGDRAEIAVRMLDDRLEDRRRSLLAFRPEIV